MRRVWRGLTCSLERLRRTVSLPPVAPQPPQAVQRIFAKADYLAAVERAKEYIAAGDLMQVQVGQRLAKPYQAEPLALYRALRTLNPSPYMYFYDLGEFQIVGASPEILVREEHAQDADGARSRKVTIRPLAGTRPRAPRARKTWRWKPS